MAQSLGNHQFGQFLGNLLSAAAIFSGRRGSKTK
jgi:hypothetical protein